MKILLQSVIAATAVYVLATFGITAFSPRGSSAKIAAEQMAAQRTTQFLNNLDENTSH
jgi:hypothetical protein